MSIGYNTSIVRDGLMFQFDLDNQKSWKGKPTTNILNNPRLLPSDPYSSYVNIGSTYVLNNIGGSGWGFSRYPNSNLSVDGGVEWLPQEQGPLSNMGVWKMRVRPGGNSETHIFRGMGSVDNTQPITISVYMKCNISGMGRIHLNVTQNGASSWGFASSYHSGNGQWERLSLTIPANSGVSSVNVVRAQCIGTTRTDDVLISNFQAEYGTFATQFVEGQRLDTASIIDIAKKNTIAANNLTYQADSGPTFDGANDYIDLQSDITISPVNQGWTAEYWFNTSSAQSLQHFNSAEDDEFNANWLALLSGKLAVWNRSPGYWRYGSTSIQNNTWYQAVFICDAGGTNMRFYINGNREGGDHVNNSWNPTYSALKTRYIGRYEYNGSYSRYFVGSISKVKMYNRALTADEVKKNFAASKKRYGL